MKNKTIIICDDDQANLDILELLLEQEAYTLIKQNDSTQLMKNIKEVGPDILLLDLWMPSISGDEIIKIIRADSELKGLPIIAFSASFDGEEVAFKAGADYYIPKPFDIDEITEIIRKIFNSI